MRDTRPEWTQKSIQARDLCIGDIQRSSSGGWRVVKRVDLSKRVNSRIIVHYEQDGGSSTYMSQEYKPYDLVSIQARA